MYVYIVRHIDPLESSVAEISNILATSRLCGNKHCFYQHYKPGKINLQVSVPMIEYLVATSYELWMM